MSIQAVCIGELIVDFVSLEPGRPLHAVERFEKHVGGSPANVAVGLHHHGVPVRLWSKVGADSLGRFARDRLDALGLAVDGIAQDGRYPTRFALVGLDERGERTFEIHNRQSADQQLRPEEVDARLLRTCRVLHVGGTTLLGEVTAETTRGLVEAARGHGCLVSFDPNIRLDRAPEAVRARLAALLPYVDVLKVGASDWDAVCGVRTPEDVLAAGCSLVVLTDGPRGARLRTARRDVSVPAVAAGPVDTTGAGDAFTAALLARLLASGRPLAEATADDLFAWGGFAAGWAARIVAHRGATAAYQR